MTFLPRRKKSRTAHEKAAGHVKGGEHMEEKSTARPRGTDSAKVIQVIVTESLEGAGTADDPCRTQRRYWGLDGELLAVGIGDPRLSQ